ncbi:MAG: tRNA pseudouridine(55) synthase TruB [SAR202 cluster bacterium Casp-Chloro-G4]|nr:tRNA pseudouridine(55) synthase TruB [Chloroflexota bacterium]PKB61018.1 MAG: tRNA pseudouridine(55) synthase TruB [SAR202 cluster bacterium Casp-Chloro-G4]
MNKPKYDGIINVDKPYGLTSMEVVRRLKRASGQKRVGHGGTLDPIATGVIAISFGQATRMMEDLINGSKGYKAAVELGVITDTYDALGEVVETRDASAITYADIEKAVAGFIGVIEQVPPMYSALKKDGRRLYELAREGLEVEREARSVMVHGIDIVDWDSPVVTIEVFCGRGFYMRSLAYDLGDALGCGGHMKSLVRLKNGPFSLANSLSLEEAEQKLQDGEWQDILHSPDVVLSSMDAVVVGKPTEDLIRNGRSLPLGLRLPGGKADDRCRAYSVDGRFLAILIFDSTSGQWRPDKVFALEYAQPEGVPQFS